MGQGQSNHLRNLDRRVSMVMATAYDSKDKALYQDAVMYFQRAASINDTIIAESKYQDLKRKSKTRLDECRNQIQAIEGLLSIAKGPEEVASSVIRSPHTQIHIKSGAIGYTYENLFSKYLDNTVTKITIEDAYIQQHYQIVMFLRFCKMAVKYCLRLKSIHLTTKPNAKDMELQRSKLLEIRNSLRERGICLKIFYSETIRDREITVDNGWIFKIGRGLDFYQSTRGQLMIGAMDLSLRNCMETKVDIFSRC
uniref:MIT domain-containing protein 1 n=1 Tax=Caligus clemensi TaxID=344056 RepID=C1C017_CALCM|nr:MIT domain-containing protein 1 [Caligus clemensi]